MHLAVAIEVGDAGDKARFVDFNFLHVAVRTDFTQSSLLGLPDDGCQRGRLGCDFAAKVFAEATVQATVAAAIGLGDYCHRCREGVPSQFARSSLGEHTGRFDWKRRDRVRL